MRTRHCPLTRILKRPLARRSQLTISPPPATAKTAGLPSYPASKPGRRRTTTIRRSRASASVIMARYRASNTCSGRNVCGKNVTSGNGKIGRTTSSDTRPLSGSADAGKRPEGADGLGAVGDDLREGAERLRLGRLRLAERDRRALITRHAGLGIERNLRQQRHPVLLRHAPAPGVAEDRGLAI